MRASRGGTGRARKTIGIQWNKGLITAREQGTLHQNPMIALAGPSVNLVLIALEPWFLMFSLANMCWVIASMLPIDGSNRFRVAGCSGRIREGERMN